MSAGSVGYWREAHEENLDKKHVMEVPDYMTKISFSKISKCYVPGMKKISC